MSTEILAQYTINMFELVKCKKGQTMGMASSQARFLQLTARRSNIEYQGQQINQGRLALANTSASLFEKMLSLAVPTPPSSQDDKYYKQGYNFIDPKDGFQKKITWQSYAEAIAKGAPIAASYYSPVAGLTVISAVDGSTQNFAASVIADPTDTQKAALLDALGIDGNVVTNTVVTPTGLPTYNTCGKRYRYYISQATIHGDTNNIGSVDKIPAGEIENCILGEITNFLQKEDNIHKYLNNINVIEQKGLHGKIKELKLSNNQIRCILSRVWLNKTNVEIFLCEEGIARFLESLIYPKEFLKEASVDSDTIISIKKDIKIARTPRLGSVLIINGEKKNNNTDPILVNAIAKSYRWNKMLKTEKFENIKDIANLESDYCLDHIKRTVRLNILSPKIVESILNGTQPPELSLQKLYKLKTLDWKEQEKLLDFT